MVKFVELTDFDDQPLLVNMIVRGIRWVNNGKYYHI